MTGLLLLLLGCPSGERGALPAEGPPGDTAGDGRDTASDTAAVDDDGDGWSAGTDCDDEDPDIHPGAAEVCDGVDEDCDGAVDDHPRLGADGLASFYADADGDGVGGAVATAACDAPEGHVATTGDCDDGDASVHPGAAEVCLDGVDQDCDGADLPCGLLAPEDAEAWVGNGGTELAMVADLGGDGAPDLLVGDGGEASGWSGGGRVWVVPGGGTGEIQREDWGLRGICNAGEMSGGMYWYTRCERLGHQVAGLGDTDGDGVEDLLVSAPGWERDGEEGAVLIVSGPLAATTDADRIVGTVQAGEGAVALGDTDGDGLGDLALLDWGTLYVHRGPVDGVVSVRDVPDRVVGLNMLEYPADYVDGDVAAVGDLDGDGVGDLAVADALAATGWIVPGDVAGEVALTDVGVPISGAASPGYAGRVAAAGDTDGDGRPDLLLGFSTAAPALFRGPFPTERAFADADATYDLAPGWDEAWDLASGGDPDGDGRDDVLLVGGGHAYRVPGALDGARALASDADLHAQPGRLEAGYAASTAADFDGDAVPELIAAGERTWIFDVAGR